MPTPRAALPALLLALSLPSCGARPTLDVAAVVSDPDASDDAGVDAGPAAPPQCSCPDAPGYVTCVLPMECCPVVGVCKNPASFNCTGSMKPCP